VIADHARLLLAWNAAINLTTITDPARIATLYGISEEERRLVRLEDVNHVLKSLASTDLQAQMATYRDPSLPLAAPVVPAIAGWIEALDP